MIGAIECAGMWGSRSEDWPETRVRERTIGCSQCCSKEGGRREIRAEIGEHRGQGDPRSGPLLGA